MERPELLVRIGCAPQDKDAAVREACKLLFDAGCVEAGYEKSMQKREATANTFLGAGLAIPHGALEDKGAVLRDGLAVLQCPAGVPWGPGMTAKLIVAIAAKGDGHIAVIRRLAKLIADGPRMERLAVTTDAGEIKAALLEEKAGAGASASVPEADFAVSAEWAVDYPAGLHARPALSWSEAAKSAGSPLRVRHGNESADPRNMVSLLQLGLKEGDVLVISAEVPAALDAFLKAVKGLSAAEKAGAAKSLQKMLEKKAPAWQPAPDARTITGIAASPGLVVGKAFLVNQQELDVKDSPAPMAESASRLEEALTKAKFQLAAVIDDAGRRLGAADAAIFKAHAALLEDGDLLGACCRHLMDGHGAAWAWNRAAETIAESLAATGNPVLAARGADVRDVSRRVLVNLDPSLEATVSGVTRVPKGSVLIARDLSPSDTANLDGEKVAALVTALGGPTSHTAILARTLGLSAVVAAGEEVLDIAPGQTVAVDGDQGCLWYDLSHEAMKAVEARMADQETARIRQAERRALPAKTRDGTEVLIAANINLPDQAALAMEMGAEGVGLMRTEFLFLERGDSPGEDEQFETYCAMGRALEGRPLIIRALDIGGDKQVAHLNLTKEDNPFLGVRGARLLLRRPDLFEPQLRALYRAAKEGIPLSVIFPMISTVTEIRAIKRKCAEIRAEVGAPSIPLGIMIEVPAAAVMAELLAREVDFFSIGTNDLTQYTLAMDRQNPVLAAEADPLHPAVLHLIGATVAGAAKHRKPVGVCGGIAGDPFGAALLAGLGVSELSMTPRDIPAVKEMIRGFDMKVLERLARGVLSLDSPEMVRALAARV